MKVYFVENKTTGEFVTFLEGQDDDLLEFLQSDAGIGYSSEEYEIDA